MRVVAGTLCFFAGIVISDRKAETARALVLEHGADYLLTVKGNQPTVQENITRHVATPPVAFPP